LKALQPGFEDEIATVCFQLVLKTFQRINASLNCMKKGSNSGIRGILDTLSTPYPKTQP
jgi:hypothetical protein